MHAFYITWALQPMRSWRVDLRHCQVFILDYTLKPLNNGHIGNEPFCPCREVVLSSEVESVLALWEGLLLVRCKMFFVELLEVIVLCPLFECPLSEIPL